MSKLKISIIVVVVLTLVGITFASIVHKVNENETISKQLLAQQISKLATPSGCTETRRLYQEGDIDAVSTWFVSYDCQTTGGLAYRTIIAALKSQAFVATTDHTIPAELTGNEKQQAFAYNFTYANKQFTANYSFIPTKLYNDNSSLQASPVTGIDLSLSR